MAGLKSHSWYPRRSNCTRALTLPMADRGCNKSLPFTPSGIWYQYGHSESIQGEARLQPMPKQTEVPPPNLHTAHLKSDLAIKCQIRKIQMVFTEIHKFA